MFVAKLSSTTGIYQPINSTASTLYPNPADDLLTVHLVGDHSMLTIMDMTGRVLLQQSLQTGLKDVSINVSQLCKGIYLTRLTGKSGCKSPVIS